jgi:hypothetical protein
MITQEHSEEMSTGGIQHSKKRMAPDRQHKYRKL